MNPKQLIAIASVLGSLTYNSFSYAQDKQGFSQDSSPSTGISTDCPPDTGEKASPAAESSPKAKKTGKFIPKGDCTKLFEGKGRCLSKTEAKMGGHTRFSPGYCPGKDICYDTNRPMDKSAEDSADQPAAKAGSKDYDQFMLSLKDSPPCQEAYARLGEKITAVKENFNTVEEIKVQLAKALAPMEGDKLDQLTPGTALSLSKEFTAPVETPIRDLKARLDEMVDIYDQSRKNYQDEIAYLLENGCGKIIINPPIADEAVPSAQVSPKEEPAVIKREGNFVFAPFAQYVFSADGENQGKLGVSAGYRTGRWTFSGRAAAILQYADVDTDTDKSNVQTTSLPGSVQKKTSDITETTTEEKDYAAVGPVITYSIGRVDLSAGLDALIGQKKTVKDYVGYMELTKGGQSLDGKKQVNDSTTETETQFGAYPHFNMDVRLWEGLYGGLEGGYNTRSDSAQGAFGLKWKF